VTVSLLFGDKSFYINHMLMHAVYPGSPRPYLPVYVTLNDQSLMHGVGGRFLRLGFWSRLWGSVTVSLLLGHNFFPKPPGHFLMPVLCSRCISESVYGVVCMHGFWSTSPPHPRIGM